MCTAVIIDADVFHLFIAGPNFDVLRSWLKRGHGVLAYTNCGRYAQELRGDNRMLEFLAGYRRGSQLKLVKGKMVRDAENTLNAMAMRSDDPHILALAMVSGATILCTNDDNLKLDFRNRGLLPKVGRRTRAVYPLDQKKRERRRFLDRRICRAR